MTTNNVRTDYHEAHVNSRLCNEVFVTRPVCDPVPERGPNPLRPARPRAPELRAMHVVRDEAPLRDDVDRWIELTERAMAVATRLGMGQSFEQACLA